MILAKSWWDSDGSDAALLVVGALLSIATTAIADWFRNRRDGKRRKADQQREALKEIRSVALDLADVHASAMMAFYVADREDDFRDWEGDDPTARMLAGEATWASIRRLTDHLNALTEDCDDAAVRELTSTFAKACIVSFNTDRMSIASEEHTAANDTQQSLNRRIGELLRTTYA